MATPITNNVIKISSEGVITSINISSEYPRTCDFCRDTYNSELTFKRHKETGKCFRFCRLREEVPAKYKNLKPRMYPRVCERCLKTYKNKHSYYKHKSRCTLPTSVSLQNQVPDVDVVELSNDDISNIPVTDNKENINDFDSKFILAIDVEEERENYSSLYPRICEFCHKVYKCKRSFSNHKIRGHCTIVKKGVISRTSLFPHRCEKCSKSFRIARQLIVHARRCGKPQLVIVPQLKKVDDFQPLPTTTVQIEESKNDPLSTSTRDFTPKPMSKEPIPSLYPRECKRCCKIYSSKQNFYRHKKWCFPDLKAKSGSIYPRTCEFCGFTFSVKHTFHRHKNRCPGYAGGKSETQPLRCEPCDRTFQNVILQRQHVKFTHPTTIQPTYPRICEKCGNAYLSRQTYCNHKRRCCPAVRLKSAKWFQIICSKCSLSFSSRQSFINHKRLCDPNNDQDKDNSLYPRECEFCKNNYSNKQAFYRHKDNCEGYMNIEPRVDSLSYPRVCEYCRRIYTTRQSFYAHKSRCTGRMSALLEQEIKNDNDNDVDLDENTELSLQDAEIETKPTNEPMYPKMCPFCRKIYANRQTFCRHKSRCVPVPPIEEIIDPGQPDAEFTYPRECSNCLGTFKCAETFEAHKFRCDFFEPIDDSNIKISSLSNCEHCRNILSQYRRIFHEHLKQCRNPVIRSSKKVKPLQKTRPAPSPPEQPQIAVAADSMEFVDCTANFCECCGVFFDSIEQLEEHKDSKEQVACLDVVISDLNPNTCDICREVFENEQEYDSHRLKCIVNSVHKKYPRFCECCQKIYKTKQSFYNHKKNCHVYCYKYFIEKDCEGCMLPFKCEIKFLEHKQSCPRIDNSLVCAEGEVLLGQ